MKDVTLHVIPTPTGGWAIRRSGAKKNSANYGDFDIAVSTAMEVAYVRKFSCIYVHDRSGMIIRKITYED